MQNATVTSLTNYESSRFEAKKLGNEITELCSYIYAAESRLLNLIANLTRKNTGRIWVFAPAPTDSISNAGLE